ncbi:MAG: ABC-type cobalamin uptake system ATPase component BtuD [Saliniramus fredricksonii]|uniref:ABC-type cobalamin uptake system ATPase component BtuD n=1 Tax=Saliniramus fredricksonii TaxID=1653334 RepID=A0A0P7XBM6_9HYPH|nr:ABC transporter ATP-binding protein [Saliniramus fredricksonii]KPQ12675.1 MAG: ABC-type cobalamin uptake system ATPase component BtuD [Saliniramus fredricksonii]SCC82648.1 iron complex transport system ATP-binding protein [Saliniramus fredricksonii]
MSCPPPAAARLALEAVTWGNGILHPVSLDLAPGRVLGVLGANGAGKSTLLRLIYRFHKPQAGRVLLDGQDIRAMPARRVAQRVAAVLQEQPTDFALTVVEIVALGRAPHRRALAGLSAQDLHIVDHALERLDLHDFAQRPFGTLSGGERQRVMVARALAQEPGLIVLDEPTNHLDIRHQLEVLRLVRGLGATVVASLHDLNLVHGFADDLLVLADGHPLAFGPVEAVLTPELIARAFRVVATPRASAGFDFALPTEAHFQATMPTIPQREKSS